MNIAGLSMNINNMNTKTAVGIALLDKTMEVNESLGTSMVDMLQKSMMETSVNPNVGNHMDIYV